MTSSDSTPGAARPTLGKRAAALVGCGVATLALALLMTRLLYTTALGIALAEALPAALWQRVDAAAGPADGESAQDPTALVLFLLCALVSALLVSVCVVLARRARQALSVR